MQIYNTMSRKKEELIPLHEGEIRMYVCGPTVYNFFHIGNARPFIVFDTMRRYLEYIGYKVTFVQNFTDIDDKMIKRAHEENTTVKDIAEKYIKEYYTDADALGVKRATVNPRATEHIPEIIELVKTLVEKGYAYPAENGDVYFSVRSYAPYGKLSGQSIESLESGARISPTELKRDPLDFALWKGEKPGEPSWDSPWGKGRPGWHIECSAMSMKILGETFDIHAGGKDLVFPHHENEIAQSEAATGKPFARYWMHNGFINIDGEKMSKSAGNFKTVRGISEQYDLEVVRLFMLNAHYRNPVDFNPELMEQAKAGYERLKTAKERLFSAQVGEETAEDNAFIAKLDEFRNAFKENMDDDLNTAGALGVFFEFARTTNAFVSEKRGKKAIDEAKKLFMEFADVFGILIKDKADEFPEEAINLLNERTEAKKAKNYARADEIREQLKAMGFAVEDTREGAKLKKI